VDGRARVKVRRVNSKMGRISVRMIDLSFKDEESFFFFVFLRFRFSSIEGELGCLWWGRKWWRGDIAGPYPEPFGLVRVV